MDIIFLKLQVEEIMGVGCWIEIFKYMYICINIKTYTYVCMYACMYIHLYIYVYAYVYVCMYINIYIDVYIHMCIYVYIHICM